MKKINLMIVGLFLFLAGNGFTADAQAQTPAAGGPGFRLGVEGGINLANLNGRNVNDVFASRLGFVGGAFLDLPLSPSLAIQPEVLYAQKGGKYNGNNYQLDYIEVPILLDITLLGPLGVILGPSIDSKVADKGVDHANRNDVGLILGAQVDVSPLLLSGRYEVGLEDVSSNQRIQNGTFTFLLGLSIL
jgi:hypothetical protein